MQLTPAGKRFLMLVLIVVVILNAFVTLYLFKTVASQQRRIDSLERNDAIKQQVQNLNSKYDGLKDRLKGLLP